MSDIKKIRIISFAIIKVVLVSFISGQDLNKNLVAHYTLNGHLKDESALNIEGQGFNITSVKGIENQDNTAFRFNGTDAYIDIGTEDRSISQSITISLWVKTISNTQQVILSKYSTQEDKGFYISIEEGYVILGARLGCNNLVECISKHKINDGRWHNIIAAINNNDWKIWVDCVLENTLFTDCQNVDLANSNKLTIGRLDEDFVSGTSNYFKGTIDHIRLYNRLLSGIEISALNQEICPYQTINTRTISKNLCYDDPFSITINNNTYNSDRPNGQEILSSNCTCDSLIKINLNYENFVEKYYSESLCDGQSISINNTIYDIDNPQGIDTLFSDSGCDTLITISLSFDKQCAYYIPNIIQISNSSNNRFKVLSSDQCQPTIEAFLIYDKWGNLIYESTKDLNEWNGFYQNKRIEAGLYIYKINIVDVCRSETIIGSLSVIH